MGLFDFWKKDASHSQTETTNCAVKVLGSGCDKCRALEAAARSALEERGLPSEVEHITDFAKIAEYGVMQTPALVIDGKVVSAGKVLSKEEIMNWL